MHSPYLVPAGRASAGWLSAGIVLAALITTSVSSAWAAPVPGVSLAAKVVVEGTISDIQARLSSRKLRCSDVVAAYLERIKAYDQQRGLNAITTVSPDALADARKADQSLGRLRVMPPLFCVPVVVKDNMGTAGMPTT